MIEDYEPMRIFLMFAIVVVLAALAYLTQKLDK